MPTIPDSRNLQRISVAGTAPVAQVDTRQAGQDLSIAAEAIREGMSARDRYQETKAESEFLIEMEKQERSLKNDEDYGTYDERYNTNLTKTLGDLGTRIHDNELRNNFIERQKLNIERGRTRVQDMAWGREVDTERRSLDEFLESSREAALETGDWEAYVGATERRINDAASAGYYSEEEAGETLNRWTDDAAVGYIETFDPQRQIEVLTDKEGPASHINADVRSRMLETARVKYSDEQAQGIVDEYMKQGHDINFAMAAAAGIEDDVLREKVESRFILQNTRKQNAEADYRADLFNEYYLPVRDGEMTIAELQEQNPGVLEEMTGAQVSNMFNAEQQAATQRKSSNQTVIDELYVLEARGDWRTAREYLMENAGQLDRADYDKWSKATAQAETPIEVKSILSAQQQVRETAEAAGIKGANVSELTKSFDNWYQTYQMDNNGKTPDAATIQNQVDFLIMQVPRGGWPSNIKAFQYNERGEVDDVTPEMLNGYATTLRSMPEGSLNGDNIGVLADMKLSPEFIEETASTFEEQYGERPPFEELIDNIKARATQGVQ